jgi:hypothetical protein
VNGGTTDLDRNDGVQGANGLLERSEEAVLEERCQIKASSFAIVSTDLVRENTEDAGLDAEADTGGDVLLAGLEPGVFLGALEYHVQDARREGESGWPTMYIEIATYAS